MQCHQFNYSAQRTKLGRISRPSWASEPPPVELTRWKNTTARICCRTNATLIAAGWTPRPFSHKLKPRSRRSRRALFPSRRQLLRRVPKTPGTRIPIHRILTVVFHLAVNRPTTVIRPPQEVQRRHLRALTGLHLILVSSNIPMPMIHLARYVFRTLLFCSWEEFFLSFRFDPSSFNIKFCRFCKFDLSGVEALLLFIIKRSFYIHHLVIPEQDKLFFKLCRGCPVGRRAGGRACRRVAKFGCISVCNRTVTANAASLFCCFKFKANLHWRISKDENVDNFANDVCTID